MVWELGRRNGEVGKRLDWSIERTGVKAMAGGQEGVEKWEMG